MKNLLQILTLKEVIIFANTAILKTCYLNILNLMVLGSDPVNYSFKLLTQNKKKITTVNPSKPLSSVLVQIKSCPVDGCTLLLSVILPQKLSIHKLFCLPK